jgi:uncharacterized membrane protein
MVHPISRRELWHAQATLLAAVALQLSIPGDLRVGSKYTIAILEFLLVIGIGITAPKRHISFQNFNRSIALLLIGLVSFANVGSLVLVINALLNGSQVPGKHLIGAALAIFVTNIIVFALWYWEIDSPGLTGLKKHDTVPKFDFPQMETKLKEGQGWEPSFFDYLYVSITNASAFSPTDTMPLTHMVKGLMSIQALISLLTVVLVTARAVNILG